MANPERLLRSIVWILLWICTVKTGYSQRSDLRPVSSTYALKNAIIHQAPGKTIEKGTILIEKGVIKSVGTNVAVPPTAMIIDADSMHVYAGFIAGLSHIGVRNPKEEQEKNDKTKTGNPSYKRAGITPDVSVRSMLSPKEKSVEEYRKLGFTAAQAVPHKGMMAGTGAIILLGGNSGEEMILKEKTSLFSQLKGANGVYPNTVIGVLAKYRDLYRKSEQARDYGRQYMADNSGMIRPEADRVLEALYPVVSKQLPVAFRTESVLDLHRVLDLKQELGFSLIATEVKQGWDAIADLKNSGTPVFLSLDLPEMKEEDKETNDEEKEEVKKQPTSEEVEQAALEARKDEFIKHYYTQTEKLINEGINVGFSMLEAKPKDIRKNLRGMIASGLSEDEALACLTTNPAKILNISNLMGTVENGKMANLIVSDKPYFEEGSMVKYVFVDGEQYEFKEKKKKKSSDGDAKVEIAGKWEYTIETPRGERSGVLSIKGDAGDYSGTITLSMNNSTNDLKDISVDGTTLSFAFDVEMGQASEVDVSVEIDGDSFEGTFNSPFGPFPMTGSKQPEN